MQEYALANEEEELWSDYILNACDCIFNVCVTSLMCIKVDVGDIGLKNTSSNGTSLQYKLSNLLIAIKHLVNSWDIKKNSNCFNKLLY